MYFNLGMLCVLKYFDIKVRSANTIIYQIPKPTSNTTPAEQRGKAWLIKKIRNQKVFVTEADKGGAILLLDYKKALDALTKEITDPEKFIQINIPAD